MARRSRSNFRVLYAVELMAGRPVAVRDGVRPGIGRHSGVKKNSRHIGTRSLELISDGFIGQFTPGWPSGNQA